MHIEPVAGNAPRGHGFVLVQLYSYNCLPLVCVRFSPSTAVRPGKGENTVGKGTDTELHQHDHVQRATP